jgi:hypothetical protein
MLNAGLPRLVPQPPSPNATAAERLRYARRWAIVAALIAVPVWVLVFVWVDNSAVLLVFVAVIVLTVLNLASLTWRIARAERQ